MTAPGFEPAAMGTREGIMYVHGYDKQLDFSFKPTGVDKIADMTKDVVEDVKEITKDVIDRPLDSLDNTVEEVADGTAKISRNAALVAIFGLLASMLAVLVSFKKKSSGLGAPPPDEHPSTVEAEGTTPPDPIDENPVDPTSDEPIDIPEAEERPIIPEVKILPWWKKFLIGLWSVIVSMFTFWKGLPDEDKEKIRENLKKFNKKK